MELLGIIRVDFNSYLTTDHRYTLHSSQTGGKMGQYKLSVGFNGKEKICMQNLARKPVRKRPFERQVNIRSTLK
jgi:hypothetical protein